jgi:ribonuclease P protein component
MIYKQGKSVINSDLVLYFRKSEIEETRIGIAISKKVGNAVERNRIKRVIKELFRKELSNIKKRHDIVFVVRKPIKGKSFHDIEKTFIDILRRAGLYIKNEKSSSSAN